MLVKTQRYKVFYYSKTVINRMSLRRMKQSHQVFLYFLNFGKTQRRKDFFLFICFKAQ